MGVRKSVTEAEAVEDCTSNAMVTFLDLVARYGATRKSATDVASAAVGADQPWPNAAALHGAPVFYAAARIMAKNGTGDMAEEPRPRLLPKFRSPRVVQ